MSRHGAGGRSLRTAWVIQPAQDVVAGWMVDAFRIHWAEVLARHGLCVCFFTAGGLEQTRALLERARCDVAFVATWWRHGIPETVRMFEAVRARRPSLRIVFLDTIDQTSTPFFGVLPHVDLFVKKQLLSNGCGGMALARYREELQGGSVVSDHFARVRGGARGEWSFGSRLPAELESRVVLGWNLGTARFLVGRMLASHVTPSRRWEERAVDVHYRVGLSNDDDWYTFHRTEMLGALEPLRRELRVIAGAGERARVPRRTLAAEIASARITVSPFGWGEVTDRDFQVVNRRSLLVKPDMSHVLTEPDIYRPGVTYVPVRWDGTDLADTCRAWLARPEEAQRIAANARAAYRGWVLGGGFARRVGEILARLDGQALGQPRSLQFAA